MTLIDPHPDHPDHPHDDTEPSAMVSRFVSSPFGVLLLGAAAVLLVDAGGTDDGAGLCIFRRCTGGYCPGCGLTRSARHLTRGEVSASWADHPWMILVSAQVAVAAAIYAFGRRLIDRIDVSRVMLAVVASNGVLLVGIWIARLVDGSIPRFF